MRAPGHGIGCRLRSQDGERRKRCCRYPAPDGRPGCREPRGAGRLRRTPIGSPRPGAGTYGPGRSAHRRGQPGSPPAGVLLCPVLHGGTGHLDRTPDLCLRARRHCRRRHHRPGSVGAVHRARSFPRRRGRRARPAARSHHRHGRRRSSAWERLPAQWHGVHRSGSSSRWRRRRR